MISHLQVTKTDSLHILQVAAEKLDNSTSGDLFLISRGYNAFIDTVLHVDGDSTLKKSTYAKDFTALCGGTNGIPAGCSVFAFEVYGGQDRVISVFNFQVPILPLACTD